MCIRDSICVVPKDAYLFNETIEENLKRSNLNASQAEIYGAAVRAKADDFIQKLPEKYHTVIGEKALKISGGEKQRLSIAQAFLKNSPILVLDEASASLDSENERLINLAVKDLKKGRATLVIAHRVSTIKSADRIVVLKDGKIVAEGNFDELLSTCGYFAHLIGEEERAHAAE